jgi:hypothetical protein
MYNGYTESAEKIAARKARILKGYVEPKKSNSKPSKPGGHKPSGSLGDGHD